MTSLQDAMAAALAAKEPTEVKYGGIVVRVTPPMEWRQSAMDAIRRGDFNEWARRTFINDSDQKNGSDDAQVFIDADLTNAQVLEFMDAYAAAAGQAPGK
jgi:hypothetical protein